MKSGWLNYLWQTATSLLIVTLSSFWYPYLYYPQTYQYSSGLGILRGIAFSSSNKRWSSILSKVLITNKRTGYQDNMPQQVKCPKQYTLTFSCRLSLIQTSSHFFLLLSYRWRRLWIALCQQSQRHSLHLVRKIYWLTQKVRSVLPFGNLFFSSTFVRWCRCFW